MISVKFGRLKLFTISEHIYAICCFRLQLSTLTDLTPLSE